MKNRVTILLLMALFLETSAKVDTLSVEMAAKKNIIRLDIQGLGEFQEKCVNLKMSGNRSDSVMIHVEAGRRLDSKDSSQQDILIVKDEFILMFQKNEASVDVRGFCCQAQNKGPSFGSVFLVGSLADEKLYQLAKYISKEDLNTGTIQSAVWSISNDHELSSVVDDGTEKVEDLRKFIAKLKGIEIPWYSITYKKVQGQVFSGKPETVTGKIDYYISDVSEVFLNIRDEDGTIVYAKRMGRTNRGQYATHINWNVGNTPNAIYTLRLYENGRKLKQLDIALK